MNAWLGGLLSGNVDPKTYPKIETLLGEERVEPEANDPAEASNNARMWGVWLQSQNKRAGVQ